MTGFCRSAVFGLLFAGVLGCLPAREAVPDEGDMAVARSLAQMLQDARTVISDAQDLINDPAQGDKHLTGEVVVARTVELYSKATGVDPRKIDPSSRKGRLLHAMMAAIGEVVDDNQGTINAKGMGFKGFIPAVFARLVAEEFERDAKDEAEVKVTAPPELVRNRKARPDKWEAEIIKTKLLDPAWPAGKPYSETSTNNGRQAFRVMVPEY